MERLGLRDAVRRRALVRVLGATLTVLFLSTPLIVSSLTQVTAPFNGQVGSALGRGLLGPDASTSSTTTYSSSSTTTSTTEPSTITSTSTTLTSSTASTSSGSSTTTVTTSYS